MADVYDHQRCSMKNQCRAKAELVVDLMAEVGRLQKDAERYRWLRDEALNSDLPYFGKIDRRAWDSEIDAAMQEDE